MNRNLLCNNLTVKKKREKLATFIHFQVSATTEHIDTEKLKAREQIMFFEEVLLFEDELHDHGVSSLSVKIVSSFLCLFAVKNIVKIEWKKDVMSNFTLLLFLHLKVTKV